MELLLIIPRWFMGKVAIGIDNATIYQALLTQKSPKNDHICVQR